LDKIKILIADDHAVVREGTRKILEQEQDLEVIAEAVDGVEAVRLATELKPDVANVQVSQVGYREEDDGYRHHQHYY